LLAQGDELLEVLEQEARELARLLAVGELVEQEMGPNRRARSVAGGPAIRPSAPTA
jgi:hypothetical protein